MATIAGLGRRDGTTRSSCPPHKTVALGMVNLPIISVFLAIIADIKNYIISRPLRKVLC